MATPAAPAPAPSLADRLKAEVDRSIQRGLKGLEYLGSEGPVVGQTPKTLLHRRGTLSLYHYKALASEVYRVPLLFVMAPTNKAFILDLTPGQSMIEYLLKRGYDIYVMDWNPPTGEERDLKLDDYALGFIPDCIRRVQEHSGEDDVTIVGYCFGGVLSAIYAALHTDGPLKNLVLFTTPVNFHKLELFKSVMGSGKVDIDQFLDSSGIVPAQAVMRGFDMLRPASRVASQVRLWDNMWNDEYVKAYRRMERWTSETLPIPGAYFKQAFTDLMQKNGLYKRTLRIGGRLVDLRKIKVPVLHVIAQYDHIVPPDVAQPLIKMVASKDKEEVILPGGHISIGAGANAIKRAWPKVDQWLESRST